MEEVQIDRVAPQGFQALLDIAIQVLGGDAWLEGGLIGVSSFGDKIYVLAHAGFFQPLADEFLADAPLSRGVLSIDPRGVYRGTPMGGKGIEQQKRGFPVDGRTEIGGTHGDTGYPVPGWCNGDEAHGFLRAPVYPANAIWGRAVSFILLTV